MANGYGGETKTFETASKDLDSELDFLNDDGYAKLRANTKSVDYNTARR